MELTYIGPDDLDKNHDPWSFASSCGINILSHMDFHSGYVNEYNRLIAALFTNFDGTSYSFDIAVAEEYRRKGLASELVDAAISEYREIYADEGKLEVHVVSKDMERLLLRKHFRVKTRLMHDDCIMYLPKKRN